ncbi:DUF2971 domain-containing protein [Providencia sp. PROV202]|uniref:DUF2971 domain-containing protein n=1 Tax=Providencia sp. PROV202 TaxID=2949902 RepID=UPI00234AEF32|nr:DUF2971 domain-containing protein [Providencia sp. PROV202]
MVNEVYKYVPPERVDILRSKRICFSKKDQLNDNFEFEVKFNVCGSHDDDLEYFINQFCSSTEPSKEKDALLSLKPFYEMQLNKKFTMKEFLYFLAKNSPEIEFLIKSILDKMNEEYVKVIKNLLCVLCLTNSRDSNYMWGHYASSYKGFMIGFNRENSFFDKRTSKDDLMRKLKDVIYVDDIPKIYLNYDLNKEGMVSHYMFHHKHTDHKQEMECRIVDIINNANFITENGFHLFDLPKGLITSVTFGHNMSTDNEAEIRNLIENDDYFDGVMMYKAIPNADTRKIDRELIE